MPLVLHLISKMMRGHIVSMCLGEPNNNLTLEILSWLPLRMIARLKSVRQLWYFTIYDPYFIICEKYHEADATII